MRLTTLGGGVISKDVLSPVLLENIQRGEAILFLGAGASYGAVGAKGEKAPSGPELRDFLSDRFLGGQLKNKPLSQVAELAKNEASLPKVQEAIRDLFLPLNPADFHLLIPRFRWHAIVTTNFDLVVERAYDKCDGRQQALAPIFSDGDNFIDKIRDSSQVICLKLHGCITHITDPKLPLILASEEYAKYRDNRERLFRHFQDWGRERPIIFCGYDVGDPNVQQILFDLTDIGMSRPSYGLVNPGMDEIVARYWASKRFVVNVMTFESFLRSLDAAIPSESRGLSALIKNKDTSISPWIRTSVGPSTNLLFYLQSELLHVHKGMPTVGISPHEFYRGVFNEWGAMAQGLDVYRRVTDDIILDAFINDKKAKTSQLYVLKGYAGSGKSVTLRRLAWDAAHLFDGFVFFLREGGVLRKDRIQELYSLTGTRISVIIDDCILQIREIADLLNWAQRNSLPLTVIAGARTNEWNSYGSELESDVENDYELKDLTEREIGQLIERLDQHKALGRLANAQQEERHSHFQLSAERQLLVALLDLSGERPFEEIVLDEYRNIRPREAQLLYLDVCTLHRLGVGVRAGLISRISGITFENFQREFFRPLEHVVRTYVDQGTRDNMYRSRHRLIAEVVFKEALPNQTDRVDQLVRIIRNMDVDYASDKTAFVELIKGRQLADLFADRGMVYQIFDAAMESGAPSAHIEHQRAVFEMHHRNGRLDRAMEAIERAEQGLERPDRAVLHTKAAILRELAFRSPQKLTRESLRERAREILQKQIRNSKVPHPFHLTARLLIDELKDKFAQLNEGGSTTVELQQRSIAETVRQAETIIYQGLQRFPGDNYILSAEAELAELLRDEKRALDALLRAFEASPGSSPVAVRLANLESHRGNTQEAIEILKRSLAANPSKEAHFAMARLLTGQDEEGLKESIAYHLRRSFTEGDSNLEAQFWYARHNFMFGDRAAAMACFRQLGEAWTPLEYRKRIKDFVLNKDGTRRRFSGVIQKTQDSFCFINCRELRTDVFAHIREFVDSDWVKVEPGIQASFEIGFALRGPQALSVKLG
jgi:tetratricopeptide (TPR) repeat protein/cold shock CspA family protein